MEMLLVLSSLAGFYFLWRTIMLTKSVEKLGKELLVSKITIPVEEKIANDSFFKFVSDSREWAFEYIDNVQKELKSFIEVADKEFNYFDKYGIVAEGSPHYKSMAILSEEYKKLKALLPEEGKND